MVKRPILLLAVLVCVALPARTLAQPTPTVAAPPDELERGTPRSAMTGFLQACRDGNYERAAEYLDLSRLKPAQRSVAGPVLARKLKVVIDHALWVDLNALSDAPDGTAINGGSARRQRVGTIRSYKGAVPIHLERTTSADGMLIWQIAATTVSRIPDLYAQFGYGRLGEWLPDPFFEITVLQIELWQWLGLGALAVVALLCSWLFTHVIARAVRPVVVRWRRTIEDRIEQLIAGPLRLGIGITLFISGSFLLGLALPVQAFFNGAAKALVVAAVTWLVLRLVDIGALRAEDQLMARGQSAAVVMLPLGRRTVKLFLIALAVLAFLQNVGFDVSGLLAGLGVGGLAVALAAQETVKNVFGGVALIADQPVRVGDLCRFGDKMGTVEDISLWSTRVRTLDRTVVSIPNAQFASMQLENLTRRDRIRLSTTIALSTDTTADQLRSILTTLRQLLAEHPKVHAGTARALFAGFNSHSLQIEISVYILTADFQQYVTIREELFLRIMDIVNASGSKLV